MTLRAVLALLCLLAAGCSNVQVTAERVEPGAVLAEASRSAATHQELSRHTRTRLYPHGLADEAEGDPLVLLQRASDELRQTGAWEDRLALAEILCLAAQQCEPSESSKYYLEAALEAASVLFAEDGPSRYDPRNQVLLGIYDVALGEVFAEDQQRAGHPTKWTALEGLQRTYRVTYRSDWDTRRFARFELSDRYRFHGIGPEHRAYGIGTPLIAVFAERGDQSYYPSRGMIVPATAVLHRDAAHHDQLVLRIEDPLAKSTIEVAGRTLPLAANYSAAAASFQADVDWGSYDHSGFFNPGNESVRAGVHVMQPYDPDKTPVVFVHGLWSDPGVWRYALNAILGDPVLRRRYQVWSYRYSTGEVLLTNAALFRRELDEVRRHFDPEGDDPATQDIVLVGHSMGGLLAGTAIRSSGTRIWDTFFTAPAEQYEARIQQDDYLRDLLFFEPRSYVHRVVFMSVPHGGSTMSDSLIGSLGQALTNTSTRYEELISLVRKEYGDILREDVVADTSIEMLSPQNPVLQVVRTLPIRDGVRYHSVIGQEAEGPVEEGTDGVVPYQSSHLDGAASELIIRSDHGTELRPEGVAEVMRILRLHLEEKGRETGS